MATAAPTAASMAMVVVERILADDVKLWGVKVIMHGKVSVASVCLERSECRSQKMQMQMKR
jgi:hypothetical protein